jgi:hypothetical protein
VAGPEPGGGGRDARASGQVAHVTDLVIGHQRDHRAGRAGPRGTTRAVQICLVLDWRVGVDDQVDVVDMDTAGRDVRGHHGLHAAVGEGEQVAATRRLGQVAVQFHRRYTSRDELAGQCLGAVLGTGEHQRAAGCRGEIDEHRHAVVVAYLQHVVRHRCDRRARRVDVVRDRPGKESLDQHVDTGVEGRREQQPLAGAWRCVEQPAYNRQEAQVGHVVRLVEHGDLHRVEVRVAGRDVVGEPARAGHQHVHTGAQARYLILLAKSVCAGQAAVMP